MVALWTEGCGGIFAIGHTFGVRVQKVQKVQKVQRMVVSPSRAMSIIMPPFGGHVHIEYHNHSVRANFARLGILRRIAIQRRSLT